MKGFAWEHKKGIKFLTVPEWEDKGVSMGFSSRLGGVSPEPFESLNLALHVKDDSANVIANRSRFLNLFSLSLKNMVCCEQVHGNSVAIVGDKELGCGALDMSSVLPGYDAMVTATPGVMLSAFYADCIPVYFFDPVNRVVAIAHSGWKGTMGRIAVNTVKAMQNNFNSLASNIEAFIGPGIGRCCFQISKDLAQQVKMEFPDQGEMLSNAHGQATWDLRLTIKLMLTEIGLNPANVIDCNYCTACDSHHFFSYRRDHGQTGRMAAVIALNY